MPIAQSSAHSALLLPLVTKFGEGMIRNHIFGEARPSLDRIPNGLPLWECRARSAHAVQSFVCQQILEP